MDSPIAQLKNYLHILYTRRYLFLGVSVTIALAIVIFSYFVPKKYEAKSTVFVEKNVIDSLMKGLTVTSSMTDRIRVLRYHMVSRDMILRVLKKLDADVGTTSPEEIEALITSVQKRINITLRGEDLFFVSLVDQDRVFARDFVNTLVSTYVQENISDKRQQSSGATRFLSEQVTLYKTKLDAIEDDINRFRQKTGIYSTVNESSLVDEIKLNEEELKLLKVKRNELAATAKTIQEQLKMMQSMAASMGSATANLDLEGSDNQWRIQNLEAKIEELLLNYNEQYPAVVKLRAQISELQNRQADVDKDNSKVLDQENFNPFEDPIFVDLKMRVNATQSDISAILAKENELTAIIENNKKILANFPQDKKQLADMERERSMYRDLYDKMLQRVGISEVSSQLEISDKTATFRVVDPAILPTQPVGTKRIMLMAMGLLAGLGAGLGAVLIREKLDDTVKSPDVIRALGVTVLAEIPHMPNEEENVLVRKRDRLIYSYAISCLLCISIMMGHDLLGLGLIDQLIAKL